MRPLAPHIRAQLFDIASRVELYAEPSYDQLAAGMVPYPPPPPPRSGASDPLHSGTGRAALPRPASLLNIFRGNDHGKSCDFNGLRLETRTAV
jgi:hypothetical protein